MNTIHFLTGLRHDLRYAGRGLRKSPGFALAVIAVLALGIGANAAIFSIVNGVLLRPLPFAESGRMVRIFHVPPQRQFPGVKLFSVSPANYLDWKSQCRSFDGMAAYSVRTHTLTGGDRPEAVRAAHVGPEFFSILREQAALGRVFLPEEDTPGRGQVAVISESFWKSHLAGNPGVVGRTLTMDRRVYTIAGVMPRRVEVSSWGATAVQIWVPMGWDEAERSIRGIHNYMVIARLKPGVALPQAGAELDAVSARLAQAYPAEDAGWGATIIPLQELIVGNVRTSLLVLLGAVGFVLLIACANVANLVLARAVGRQKEIALRTALGAGRAHILRQMLAETFLLAAVGGAAGLLLARGGLRLIVAAVADQLPRADEIALDGRVLAFTAAISLLTGVAAGLLPALRAGRADLNEMLKQGFGRTESSAGGARARHALVISEVALSLMLLIGAGLMIRTLWALQRINPGFDPHHVLTLSLPIPSAKYDTPARQTAFYDEVLRRVRALAAVDSAALIDNLPITGGSMQPIAIEGRASGSMAEQPEVAVRQSSPDYLRTMRIPLLRGRDFAAGDTHVVLISESMARRFWPGQNPLGARMRFTLVDKEKDLAWEVVGVVGDIQEQVLASDAPTTMVYQWTRERPWTFLNLAARTTADPAVLVQPIAAVIHQVDAELPMRNVASMDEIVAQSISTERFNMQLLAAFAGMALLLAAVGIYSLLAYAVRRRTREIGIRTALGAGVNDVVSLVVIEGLKPALIGVAIGLAGALSLNRVLRGLVHGVSAADPLTFGVVALLLLAIAVLASLAPAWRAARVDPLRALREE